MQNPWLRLRASQPFVAPEDTEILKRLGRRLQGPYELRLDLRPQPWTGNVNTAQIFVLALNPGFHPDDYLDLRNADYAEQWRLALTFETRIPFYFLDPAFHETCGYLWWRRRLRHLIDAADMAAVSQRVMCVEHFPYKSFRYKPLGETLPSQQYSFELIREAIRQRKEIVVMRSVGVWLESVPELRTYPYIRLSNNQNPYFSRTQMAAEQFDRLSAALRV